MTLEDWLHRFRPPKPPRGLRERILEEAADAPFVARLRKIRPSAPSADLRGRILAAAGARARRRVAAGRLWRAAAALLIALSVPANAWIENRFSRGSETFRPTEPSAVASVEDPVLRDLPEPFLRMQARVWPAMSLDRFLALRAQWQEEVLP